MCILNISHLAHRALLQLSLHRSTHTLCNHVLQERNRSNRTLLHLSLHRSTNALRVFDVRLRPVRAELGNRAIAAHLAHRIPERVRRFLARLGRREDLVPLRVHVLVLLGHGVRVLEVTVPVDRPVEEFEREGRFTLLDAKLVVLGAPLPRKRLRALHVLGEVLALLLPREALLLLALAPGGLVGLPCHAHPLLLALQNFLKKCTKKKMFRAVS